MDRKGEPARVVHEPRRVMQQGDAETITAAVTVDQNAPAPQILRRPQAAEESGFLISCVLQARLTASELEFSIDDTSWQERRLLTSDTVRWSWFVTPKRGGTHTLVLEIRPIVKVQPDSQVRSAADVQEVATVSVHQFETVVRVEVPWDERLQDVIGRVAATLEVAEELVTALAALIVALIGLAGVVGLRRRHRRGRAAGMAGAAGGEQERAS